MVLKKISKKVLVDTGSRVLYSLVVGALIDYYKGGLTGWGIVGSRATATGTNSLTSGPYGLWQDKWYSWLNVTPESIKLRDFFKNKTISEYFDKNQRQLINGYLARRGKQFMTDMIAFNTFEPLVYGISNVSGQLFSQLVNYIFDLDVHPFNVNDVFEGMKTTVYLSPFIAPTMRWTMQSARKIFGIKTSAQRVEKKLEEIIDQSVE